MSDQLEVWAADVTAFPWVEKERYVVDHGLCPVKVKEAVALKMGRGAWRNLCVAHEAWYFWYFSDGINNGNSLAPTMLDAVLWGEQWVAEHHGQFARSYSGFRCNLCGPRPRRGTSICEDCCNMLDEHYDWEDDQGFFW